MKRNTLIVAVFMVFVASSLVLAGCSGNGKGGNNGLDASKTTIQGKVTLSGTIAGGSAKPGLTVFMSALDSSKISNSGTATPFTPGSDLRKALAAASFSDTPPLSNATVELYDADHPEWIYPIAISLSDVSGNYSLDTLANAAENNASYTNGDPIPAGNYTVIASKYDTNVGKLFVGIQAVIKRFAGNVTGNDLQAPDSDAVPEVAFINGYPRNADGAFGGTSVMIPVNRAVPVTFSMPMARLRAIASITVTDATTGAVVDGTFTISPDLLTVTFHPADLLNLGDVYSVKVLGGLAPAAAKNIYGIPTSATVTARFTASDADNAVPRVYPISPVSTTNVPIITPIRIASTEPLDVNTFMIAAAPSIGDKPFVRYVGYYNMTITGVPTDMFVYEIVPSIPLQINTSYDIVVSNAKDMAGNTLPATPITFTTEATSAGIIPTDMATRVAVKDVFGKWLNAVNSRNAMLLTTYMTGDFYWFSKGNSSDDLNRDGRLSLNEFTAMLEKQFDVFERCGTTISGDILDDSGPGSGISIQGSAADIKFTLAFTSSNTTDPSCNMGPPQIHYARLGNINSGWLITNGSDNQVAGFPPPLQTIQLVSPAAGTFLPEPTASEPLVPEFSWLGVAGVKTYAIVIVDTRSPWSQAGWVGLVDGTGTADTVMKAMYSNNGGYQGNVFVLGAHPSFGFHSTLQFKAGGSYRWAVLGFKTLDINVMSQGGSFDTVPDLVASSATDDFDVLGAWKELTISVKDSQGNSYPYSDYLQGFNVGSATNVTIAITSPNNTSSVVKGSYYVSGHNQWLNGQLTFNAYGVSSIDNLTLSSKQNNVYLDDGKGLQKSINIYTTGASSPNIIFNTISGYTCANDPSTSFQSDPWGHYTSNDICTVDIAGYVTDPLTITQLQLNVNSDSGWYSSPTATVAVDGTFTFSAVPVFMGWNQVSVYDTNNWQNENDFSVQTAAGSVMPSGVDIGSVLYSDGTSTSSATKVSQSIGYNNESYWDAGAAASITISGNIKPDPVNGFPWGPNYYFYVPEVNGWLIQSNGQVSLADANTGAFTQSFDLVNGWNVVEYDGPVGNSRLFIYTTGGTPFVSPHIVTNISDPVNAAGEIPNATTGYIPYDAGASCTVTISGQTTNAGTVNMYMSAADSTGQSYYEYLTSIPTTTSGSNYTYSITKNVYNGVNSINLYDSQWIWQGVQVTSSCPNMPVSVHIVSVNDGVSDIMPDQYGYYRTASQTVTILGSAKAGKLVQAQYYNGSTNVIKTTTALAGDQFSISVPLISGGNNISLSDGNTSAYAYVLSSYGASYVAPINTVRVDGLIASSGGANTDSWGAWSTTATNVNVTGTIANGCSGGSTVSYVQTGTYNTNSGSYSTCGAFTFPITLDTGVNYITLADPSGLPFYMTITTTGGVSAPQQAVTITNPAQGTTTSGAVTVMGTIDPTKFSSGVGTVYAYVYDYYTWQGTYYSSNPSDVTNLGYQPLRYTPGTQGTFLFTANVVSTGYKYMIEVYAYDPSGTVSHGQTIWLNTAGYPNWVSGSSSYFKPGTAQSTNNVFLNQSGFLQGLKK